MKMILILINVMMVNSVVAQSNKPEARVEKVNITYNDKTVKARRLTMSSQMPMDLEKAWQLIKTPRLLQFVAKGMISFKPVGDSLPAAWQAGETYAVKMRLWGFLPFGGKHYLYIDSIDNETFVITTREWDKAAKVWNHKITLQQLDNGLIHYEDEIILYGGWMTGIITAFARRFYKHRQRRWQLVAEEKNFF